MKKTLVISLVALVLAVPAFATYIVVLKSGEQYKAKAKWTIVNGKAIVQLENGQSLQLNPADIDVAKSEQVTKLGLGEVGVIDLNSGRNAQPTTARPQQSTLGNTIKLRNLGGSTAPSNVPTAGAADAPLAPVTGPVLSAQVIDKFDRAYENVGIFEKKLSPTGPNSLRAELTADNEEKVFNAISATSLLIDRNAFLSNVNIEVVELYMRTTTGGAAGRFKMTREDARWLETIPANRRQNALHEYFVHKVLF